MSFSQIISIPVRSHIQLIVNHLLINPIPEYPHIDVHTRGFPIAATDPPGDDPRLMVASRLSGNGTHQRTAAVAAARVLLRLPTGTDEAPVQLEVSAQSRLPQRVQTPPFRDDRHFDRLEDGLEVKTGSFRRGGGCYAICVVPEGARAGRRDADGPDFIREMDGTIEDEHGEVVLKSGRVMARVDEDLLDRS